MSLEEVWHNTLLSTTATELLVRPAALNGNVDREKFRTEMRSRKLWSLEISTEPACLELGRLLPHGERGFCGVVLAGKRGRVESRVCVTRTRYVCNVD